MKVIKPSSPRDRFEPVKPFLYIPHKAQVLSVIKGETMMRIGVAADYSTFMLKEQLATSLLGSGMYNVVDFGAYERKPGNSYYDFTTPLARAVGSGQLERGVAFCGSSVEADSTANTIPGVHIGLIHAVFSVQQGVKGTNVNVFCLGEWSTKNGAGCDLLEAALHAQLQGALYRKYTTPKVQPPQNQASPIKSSLEDRAFHEYLASQPN